MSRYKYLEESSQQLMGPYASAFGLIVQQAQQAFSFCRLYYH